MGQSPMEPRRQSSGTAEPADAPRTKPLRYRLAQIFLTHPGDDAYFLALDVIRDALRSDHAVLGRPGTDGQPADPSGPPAHAHARPLPGESAAFPRAAWIDHWNRARRGAIPCRAAMGERAPDISDSAPAALAAPVRYRDQLVAVIIVANKSSDYDEDDLRLLETIAADIAPILSVRGARARRAERRIAAKSAPGAGDQEPPEQLDAGKNELARTHLLLEEQSAARRRLASDLKEISAKYLSLLDAIPDMLFHVHKDGTLLAYKDGAERNTFLPEQGLLGNSVADLLPADLAKAIGEHLERASNSGQNSDFEWQLPLPYPHGKPHFFEVRAVPSGTDEVLFIIRDVTAQHQAVDSLRESEARFRMLFDCSPDAVFVEDTEGNVLDVNPAACELHALEREQLIGKHVLELVPPEQRDEVARDFPKLVTGELDGLEGFSFTANRGPIPVELRTRLIKYSGKPAVLLQVRDITRRRSAEEGLREKERQLRHAQKMEAVGTLAGGLAHDFNNLMTVISCYCELLTGGLEGQEGPRRDIESIAAASGRAAELTRQLLTFSRKQMVIGQALDLNQLLGAMQGLLRRLIGEDIEIVLHPADDLIAVRADRGQIEQVVMNLAINARDAMPKGGRIDIRTANVAPAGEAGPAVRLTVQDAGIGMDEETLARIFEPYFTTKGMEKGTGLGLSVAYGIVKEHGGSMTATSSPGHGSTFEIVLPGMAAEPQSAPAAEGPLGDLRGKGECILLVEDQSDVRETASRVLGDNGYQVFEAVSAAGAEQLFAELRSEIDLVLSDVILADGSGLDLVERLRTSRPGLPVLLSSGYVDDKLGWPEIERRAYPFLPKPYGAGQLLRAVRGALEGVRD